MKYQCKILQGYIQRSCLRVCPDDSLKIIRGGSVERSRSYVRFGPVKVVSNQSDAQDEGVIISQSAACILAVEKVITGLALL